MKVIERKIDKLGRIVLPMDFRRALGLEGEANVAISINGGTISVRAATTACKLCGATERVTELMVCPACVRKIKKSAI